MRKISVALAATALLTLTGCAGGESEPAPGAESGASAEAAPEPTEAPSSEAPAPNLGERALRLGEPREGSLITTTLLEFRQPYPPGTYRRPDAGHEWAGLRIEQCLKGDADPAGLLTSGTGDWAALTRDGEEFTGATHTWVDWPAPRFPDLTGMIPGRCSKGWIALQVPEGTKFDRILWRAEGVTPIAEWLVEGQRR